MTTQITVETLSPITHNHIPVITTELLAQVYCTDTIRIQQNHQRNKGRFIEGKHFYKLMGDELNKLRLSLRESQNLVSPKTRSLILWTERGAARHAKMLETDQAWEVFERLEDCYFNRSAAPVTSDPQAYQLSGRLMLTADNGLITNAKVLRKDEFIGTLSEFFDIARRAGYFIIHEDDLLALMHK